MPAGTWWLFAAGLTLVLITMAGWWIDVTKEANAGDHTPVVSLGLRYGCFDYDPFAALLPGNVGMVQQDIASMLHAAFDLIEAGDRPTEPILVPCLLRASL